MPRLTGEALKHMQQFAVVQAKMRGRFPLLTVAELAAIPSPEWRVDGLVPDGLVTIYGQSGVYKTFLALDWALCVATGKPWNGFGATQGSVVYIAAEGGHGLRRRIEAWSEYHETDIPTERFHVVPKPINLLRPEDVSVAAEAVGELQIPPSLVIVDTMARSIPGGDENAAQTISELIANLDRIAGPYGASRWLIHHTGKSGQSERGSGALRGASDAMVWLKLKGSTIWVDCDKQKEAAPFDSLSLVPESGAESVVLRVRKGARTVSESIGHRERTLLGRVRDSPSLPWMTAKELAMWTGLAKSTHYEVVKNLERAGLVETEDARKPGARYRFTEAARTYGSE